MGRSGECCPWSLVKVAAGIVNKASDFFISYTARDEGWATWVAWRLELAGYRVVLQALDFGAGNFIARMEEAVREAELLLAILSESYLESKWGREEWTAYMDISSSNVIPVQVEDVNTRSLLRSLRRINLIGLEEGGAEEKLLLEIGKLAGQPKYDSRERQRSRFPGIANRVSVVSAGAASPDEMSWRPVSVDQDHIQLVLIGDGEACREAISSFRRLFDVPSGHCCDLFGAALSADEQLGQLTELMRDIDSREISDVLVVFAGRGSSQPDKGVLLHVRATDPQKPASTSIGLSKLLELFQDERHRLRSSIILDAVDASGGPVGPADPASVPVLTLGRHSPGGGLLKVKEMLARDPHELLEQIPHWGSLSLADLRVVAGGELVALENSPGHEIGLVPSPLAWPRQGRAETDLANWCAVFSESDGRSAEGEPVAQVVNKLAAQSRNLVNQAYHRRGRVIELAPSPGKLLARNILSSPRSFANAVEQVCRAELAIFDLTNFEPAVMIVLGIRAVIRRGLSVCVAREHDPPWRDAEPPFHLREVSLITPPSRDAVEKRILEGIKQLAQPGSSYSDLPCFDLIRGVPPDPEQRQARAFDAERNPSILALVPFDPKYVRQNWKEIKDSLPATARSETMKRREGAEEVEPPRLQRTLDLDSPRVVSAQLFEAIRLTDFCMVDVTSARPNVFFELGVRLAANRLHPVVVVDPGYEAGNQETAWFQIVKSQFVMFQRLLQPVNYTPTNPDDFSLMVERHLELRRLLREQDDPRAESLLGGLPTAGVYNMAWQYAAKGDEVATMPVEEHLQSGGEELLVDQSSGERHLIYPTKHELTYAADQTGREYLIAAWLYLHFRKHAGDGGNEELSDRYHSLTDKLIDLLEQTGDQSDASFRDKIEFWQAAGGHSLPGPEAEQEP